MRKYLYLIAAMGLLVACQQGEDKRQYELVKYLFFDNYPAYICICGIFFVPLRR